MDDVDDAELAKDNVIINNVHKESKKLCKIYLSGLDPNSTELSVKNYFELKWGDVTSVRITTKTEKNRTYHIGFVAFKFGWVVDQVLKERPHLIDGKLVQVRRAMSKELLESPGNLQTSTEVFVTNLSSETGIQELKMYFEQFGRVVDVRLKANKKNGHPFAFVTFDHFDSPDKIVLTEEHTILGKRVSVRKATPRRFIYNRVPALFLDFHVQCVCGGQLSLGGPNFNWNGDNHQGCTCCQKPQQQKQLWRPPSNNIGYWSNMNPGDAKTIGFAHGHQYIDPGLYWSQPFHYFQQQHQQQQNQENPGIPYFYQC